MYKHYPKPNCFHRLITCTKGLLGGRSTYVSVHTYALCVSVAIRFSDFILRRAVVAEIVLSYTHRSVRSVLFAQVCMGCARVSWENRRDMEECRLRARQPGNVCSRYYVYSVLPVSTYFPSGCQCVSAEGGGGIISIGPEREMIETSSSGWDAFFFFHTHRVHCFLLGRVVGVRRFFSVCVGMCGYFYFLLCWAKVREECGLGILYGIVIGVTGNMGRWKDVCVCVGWEHGWFTLSGEKVKEVTMAGELHCKMLRQRMEAQSTLPRKISRAMGISSQQRDVTFARRSFLVARQDFASGGVLPCFLFLIFHLFCGLCREIRWRENVQVISHRTKVFFSRGSIFSTCYRTKQV